MFGSKVIDRRVRSRVLVTLKSGETFDGVLWEFDKTAIVLRNASELAATTNPDPSVTPIDGEFVVLVADVRFMQIP